MVNEKAVLSTEDLPLVVIDPGHGGKNTGATGYYQSTEKEITLMLAHRIAFRLKDRWDVLLTRMNDNHVPLEERTSIANHAKPQAFISIHLGASYRLFPEGVRTYFWQPSRGETFFSEMFNQENITDNRPPLWDHLQYYHLNSSKLLAQCIHNSILSQVHLHDRKIDGTPIFVLAGADMPAILIEIGYITRPKEEKKLIHPPFLDKIAHGIALGLDQFVEKISFSIKTDLHF